jgi:TPR repeat protein
LNIGNIYGSRGGGVPQNNVEALRWYRMSADTTVRLEVE